MRQLRPDRLSDFFKVTQSAAGYDSFDSFTHLFIYEIFQENPKLTVSRSLP